MKTSGMLAAGGALGLLGAAAVRELRTPSARRRWHGRVLGVPYDLRPPTVERVRAAWFNPDDPRVLTPREFGVGWALNVGRLARPLLRRGGGGRSAGRRGRRRGRGRY